MREFRTIAFDNVTGLRMILSECSYNFACDYLYNKGFTHYSNFENSGGYVTLTFTKPMERVFVYDESRGYLMMEDE